MNKDRDDFLLSFTDNFPSIEVDIDHWKSLKSWKLRGKYLMRLLFQEKDMAVRLSMMNYIIKTTGKVGRAFIKNKEFIEYLDVLEYSTHLFSVTATVGNLFKAKQSVRNTRNNAMAKMMGNHLKTGMTMNPRHPLVKRLN